MDRMMASNFWPLLLDYSNDECKRVLRKLELEAYASVISAFRAQGEMSKEKKKMLQELSLLLSISFERHKAEIRRAVNDEQLNTIADRLSGPNTSTEWAIEGRRLLPPVPRLVPQTAFTAYANLAADTQAAKNITLPFPSATGYKDPGNISLDSEETVFKLKRPPSDDLDCFPPEKMFMPDSYSATGLDKTIKPCLDMPMEEESEIVSSFTPAAMSQCMLQSLGAKDVGCSSSNTASKKNNSKLSASTAASAAIAQKTTSSSPSSVSSKSFDMGSSPFSSVSITSKAANIPAGGSTPSLSTYDKHFLPGIFSSSANHPTEHNHITSITPISQIEDTKSVNSISTPLSSLSGNHQVNNMSVSTNGRPTCRPKEKYFPNPRASMRPRLNAPSLLLGGSSSSAGFQNPQSQISSTSQSGHKTVSPPKSRGPCPRASSPAVCPLSPVTRCQPTATTQQSFTRGLQTPSCVSSTSVGNNSNTSSAASAPFKQCSVAATLSSTKSSISSKSISKSPPSKLPCGPKPMMSQTNKTFVSKNITSSQATRLAVQPCVKMTQSNTKTSVSITCSQKTSSQIQNKSGSSVTKAITYRNESGLKIVSQNMHTNWLVSKSSASVASTSSTTTTSRLANSTSTVPGVTGSARIINFSQPINARFARASITSAPTSISSTIPNTGLRVALPTTSNMRASMPAKPNVIVVHKAQVWNQTPGATIVMTSSTPLSRIASETLEAVTLMQRQELNRHSSSSHRGSNIHQSSSSLSSLSSSSAPASSTVITASNSTLTQSSSKKVASFSTTDNDQVEVHSNSVTSTTETENISKEKISETTPVSSLLCEDSLADSPANVKSVEDVTSDNDVELLESPDKETSIDISLESSKTSLNEDSSADSTSTINHIPSSSIDLRAENQAVETSKNDSSSLPVSEEQQELEVVEVAPSKNGALVNNYLMQCEDTCAEPQQSNPDSCSENSEVSLSYIPVKIDEEANSQKAFPDDDSSECVGETPFKKTIDLIQE